MDALAERSTRPARVKPAPRPVPVQDAGYAHLSLDDLRAYRSALQSEEAKVSYWRRIIQARLDVVRAGSATSAGALDAAHLAPVLTDSRISAGRTALCEVLPVDDIPPLPSLGELWERQVDETDESAMTDFETSLAEAEEQLSTYRTALHAKLADATGQLIARYRDEPALALTALPLPKARRPV
jgi:hypothetical protein